MKTTQQCVQADLVVRAALEPLSRRGAFFRFVSWFSHQAANASRWAANKAQMKTMKPSLTIILLLILVGCTSNPIQSASLVSNTATFQPTVSKTARPSETLTQTPRPTLALSPVPTTNSVATLNAEATADALEGLCDEFKADSSRYSRISPNGEWAAITCGYKRNQTLVVQNQAGARWVLKFADFLGPGFEEMPGSFAPLAWSADGRFLYFSKVLGYSGGGNQCFPGFGVDGLFRLHLRTGTLTTFIPSSDGFPGNEIRFSPTNEFYAVDIDGVRITNVVSGKVTSIHSPGVMEMSWSPDGKFLAYSVATCGEDLVEDSSIFIWDSSTNETQLLFSTQEMLLRPDSWINSSTLRFEGEKWVNQDNLYTIFEYDLRGDKMILSGTATPRP